MDDKGSRRRKSNANRRRRTQVKIDKRMFWKFLSTYKNTLITSLLLILITCLLFGVFSQLQAPVTSAVPGGVTEVAYSTFIQQVKAGNVQAVAIQGEGINSLLIHPLTPGSNPTGSAGNQTATPSNTPNSTTDVDYTSWLHYVGASSGSSSLSGPTVPSVVNAGRAIYTHELPSGDEALLPLLRSAHVTVETLAPAQPSPWLALFLRFMPVLLLVVLLLVFLYARRNSNTSRSMDDRVTQIGKSRARRFVRTKEGAASPNETRTTRNTGVTRPTSPTTPVRAPGARPTTIRVSTEPQVTFADVAGIDEVRIELEEIVQFLRQPERFDKLGARIPRGALLVGPPGTGKTLLAKAVAGEAHVPFFSMSASEFVEMFVGVGASRVRDLFHQARQVAPCVIFIDEIDAVGRKRSSRMMGNDERDQTLNQLLVELDGFDARQAIVVMAATNRVDILDKALLRPGRFDRHITISPPDRIGREAILKVHTRNTPLHEEISLERLARLTTGMTGADLANLVNEAALTAARRDLEHLTHDCFEDALARVQLGALRPLVMSARERRIIAYHEGGHALVAHYLPEADRVNRVTILPRGQSLGVTQFTAEEDRYNYSRETLMARIAVGLGGRVAEELTFGPKHITTGAENDFQVVTNLARRMVTRWGMSEQLGVIFADAASEGDYALNMHRIDPADLPSHARALRLDADGQPVLDDDPIPARTHLFAMTAPRNSNGVMLNALIDSEVQHILQEGQEIARTLLLKHNKQLALLADTLMECEQLDRTQFETLLKEA